MTTKDMQLIANPWEVWPNGIIPANGNLPEWKLRTSEEGKAWLKELADKRKAYPIPDAISALDLIRQERNGE